MSAGYNEIRKAPRLIFCSHASNRMTSNPDIDKKDDRGNTDLHRACKASDLERVKQLVRSGASVYIENDNTKTPIYKACKYGSAEMIKFLADSVAGIGNCCEKCVKSDKPTRSSLR